MKVIKLIIVLASCFIIAANPNSSVPECLYLPYQVDLPFPSPFKFGTAMSMNDTYLAIGDPVKNRVYIYSRNSLSKWQLSKEISPPENSIPDKIGSGFGSKLFFDGNTLFVVASIHKEKNKVNNPEYFQYTRDENLYFNAVYKIDVERNNQVQRIDKFENKPVVGNSIVADKNQIIFVTNKSGKFSKINIMYSNGKVHQISRKRGIFRRDFFRFVNVRIKNNLLLVSSFNRASKGKKVFLFDLNSLEKKPKIFYIPGYRAGSTLAISNQFIVVGESRIDARTQEYGIPQTFIISINNGSTTAIDGYGKLSLDKNILTRIKPRTYGGFTDPDSNLLEVFRIDDNATPHLIKKHKIVLHALVKNNLLTTVQETLEKKVYTPKICIQPVY